MTATMLRKTYKYRLYPNQAQEALMTHTLDLCRELYNAAIQERRDAWDRSGGLVRSGNKRDGTFRLVSKHPFASAKRTSVSKYDQQYQLPALKADDVRPDLKDVYAQVLCDVITRVEKSFDGFFRRVRMRQVPGFPKFQNASRYNSFTYPQHGFKLSDDSKKLVLSKIGEIKIRLHRPCIGKLKTCTITRESSKWFVCFSVETTATPLEPSPAEVGVNIGIRKFAVLSDGSTIDNPRFYERLHKKLARAQRKLSRRHKRAKDGRIIERTKRGEKAAAEVRAIHEKIKRCRNDFQHNVSKQIVADYGTIVVEDLTIPSMTEEKWGRAIHDSAWAMFHDKLQYKSAFAERRFVKIPTWKREGTIDIEQKYVPRKTDAARESLRRGKEILDAADIT